MIWNLALWGTVSVSVFGVLAVYERWTTRRRPTPRTFKAAPPVSELSRLAERAARVRLADHHSILDRAFGPEPGPKGGQS